MPLKSYSIAPRQFARFSMHRCFPGWRIIESEGVSYVVFAVIKPYVLSNNVELEKLATAQLSPEVVFDETFHGLTNPYIGDFCFVEIKLKVNICGQV